MSLSERKAAQTKNECSDADGTGVSGGRLTWTKYDSFEPLREMRLEWDSFVENIGGDIFTSFDWCELWWKHFGSDRRLEVQIAKRGGEIAAIFPLFRESMGAGPFKLRLIRLVGCDHCVTTCGPAVSPDCLDDAIRGLIDQLSCETWDVLHFGEMPGYAAYASHMERAFRGNAAVRVFRFGDNDYPHMVFDLPSDMNAYLASLSVKERRNVRKDLRDLEQGGRGFSMANASSIDSAFDELELWHGTQWAAKGRLGHFGDWPGVDRFHREFAGRCKKNNRLFFLRAMDSAGFLASEYFFCFGNRMHWLIGARADGVSSRVGFLGLLEHAFAGGIKQIDALPGLYDYKRRLGAQVLGVKNLTVLSSAPCAARTFSLHRTWAMLLSKTYHHAWYWKAAPWLRIRMPHLFGPMLRAGMWRTMIRCRCLVQTSKHSPDGESPEAHPET